MSGERVKEIWKRAEEIQQELRRLDAELRDIQKTCTHIALVLRVIANGATREATPQTRAENFITEQNASIVDEWCDER